MKNYTWFFVVLVTLTSAFTNTAMAQTNCVVLGSVAHCPAPSSKSDRKAATVVLGLFVIVLIGHGINEQRKKDAASASFDLDQGKPSTFSIEPIIEQDRFGGRFVWRF